MASEWFIDPATLGAKPRRISGELKPEAARRLREQVSRPQWSLRYEVRGGLDESGRRVVSCIIKGFVPLLCQVTAEEFEHPVQIEDRLVLVEDESQLPPLQDEPDGEDHVVAEGPIDVRELVEEAVLLALPMIPRKPGAPPPAPRSSRTEAEGSPFAALRDWKKRR